MKQKFNKVCAIICEYNPMHTGHIHLINKAKEITKCDIVLGLMSGNFSQRAKPCVLNKYTRAKIAVDNGLDFVVNFPTAFCINNAEIFALSAIKILNQLRVTHLAFGVETLNEEAFYALAKFLLNEPLKFKKLLKEKLKDGNNYSATLYDALKENLFYFNESLQSDILKIITRPNNILALEYIKALIKTKSKILPVLIERVDNFNNNKIINNFVSSSYIRQNLDKNFKKIEKYLPKNSISYFNKNSVDVNLFNNIKFYNLKTFEIKKLKNIYGVTEGLENRLLNLANNTNNFENFYNTLTTRRYKNSRLNSVLLNCLLNVDKYLIKKLYTTKFNIKLKVLALNPKNKQILSKIDSKNLILRKSDMQKLKFNNFNKKIMQIENKANSLYNVIAKTNLIELDYYNKMQ